jgi:hypothetical protein
MKRLRHPIKSAREPFGKAGLIVAIVALVAAIGGTAFAAGKLTSGQKKEVEKIAKKSGKPGPAGPQGPAGPAGAKGENGAPGTNGTNGTNGKSVTVEGIAEGESECEERGGAKVEQEGGGPSAEVCNGETGFTSTLPKGKTETGVWAVHSPQETVGAWVPLSFSIPLEYNAASLIHSEILAEGEEETTNCPGTAIEPKALEGFLCVYTHTGAPTPVTTYGIGIGSGGVGTTGAILRIPANKGGLEVEGSWAVTAP